MPNYLESQPDNIYAMQRMGSTFSDAIIGMAEAAAKRRQLEQQNLMEQRYYGLAQNADQRAQQLQPSKVKEQELGVQQAQAVLAQQSEAAKRAAMIGQAGTWGALSIPQLSNIINSPTGQQIYSTLQQGGAFPQRSPQFNPTVEDYHAALIALQHGGLEQTVAMNPAASASLIQPTISRPEETLSSTLDPSQVIARNPVSDAKMAQFENQLAIAQAKSENAQALLAERVRNDQIMEAVRQQMANAASKNADSNASRAETYKDQGNAFAKYFGQTGGNSLSGPGTPSATPQQSGPKKVSSKEEYDALPDGTQYVDDSGHIKTKGVK